MQNQTTYNPLNLPARIEGPDFEITYVYSADGVKLQQIVTANNETTTMEYSGPFNFINGELYEVRHAYGELRKIDEDFEAIYKIYDHGSTSLTMYLGSPRVVFWDEDGDGEISSDEVLERIDYYPFGLEHHRSIDAPEEMETHYRYTGQEHGPEGLPYYDYIARQFDPALGRFLGIDPAANVYVSLSPYAYVANNPLIYIDPTGAYIEPSSQKEWERQTGYVTAQRDQLQRRIDRLTSRAVDKGWSSDKLAGRLGNLGERVTSLNSTIAIFEKLESSTQGYSLAPGAGEVGLTYFDPSSGYVVISFSTTANFVHEATHAGQFETGDLAFQNSSAQLSYAHDLFDEVAEYKAEFAFSGTSVGGATSRASSFSEITPSFVKGLTTSKGVKPYANHGIIPININSTKADLIKAYPHAAGVLKGMPANFTLKSLPNIIYKK